MNNIINFKHKLLLKLWLLLVTIILLLGIFFRIAYLGEKIYWVDEVATSMRINGYYQQEVISQLSQQSIISITDLQKYQKITPQKTWSDTINALKTSPEHAPLYFILARFWINIWGDSVIAIRSLSVIFSLICLPCFYWLSKELFDSSQIPIIAMSLMTVSPFFVAYAQEARPYSLWTLTILLSSITFLKAIQNNNWLNWLFYSLSLILNFYTSLLSILVIFGQLLYIFWNKKIVKPALLAVTLAFLGFIPWLLVIFNSLQRLENNTVWMQEPMDIISMMAIWLYSIAIIFIESPIHLSLNPVMIMRIIVDFSLFILIGFAFYYLINQAKPKVFYFILFIFIIPRLIFIFLDLVGNKQASTAPRYMIPLYLGIELTLAYLLASKSFFPDAKNSKQKKWTIIFISIISIGLISGIFNLKSSPKYQKTRNLDNIPITNIINQTEKPLIISETKNTLDLISLSYILQNKVKIKLLSSDFNHALNLNQFDNIFLFNPSDNMIESFKRKQKYTLAEVYQPYVLSPDEIHLSLWQIN